MNDIAKVEANPIKEFQEKIAAKVREDVAGMLPEEAIAQLAGQAIKDIFFEPRTIKIKDPHQSWGDRMIDKHIPSYFNEAIAEAAKPLVKEMAEKLVKQHKKVIHAHLEQLYSDNKLMLELLRVTQSQTEIYTQSMAQQVVEQIKIQSQ